MKMHGSNFYFKARIIDNYNNLQYINWLGFLALGEQLAELLLITWTACVAASPSIKKTGRLKSYVAAKIITYN